MYIGHGVEGRDAKVIIVCSVHLTADSEYVAAFAPLFLASL